MKKFAVFDIDGTLIRWQLFHILVDRLAKQGALGTNASEELRSARLRWKKREPGYNFNDYEMVLVKNYEAALQDISPQAVDSLVDEVINEYKDQSYTYTRELISHLKGLNYFLIAISGSHHELVGHIAEYYGFDEYAGSRYERINGKFTGQIMVASQSKKQILNNFIKHHNLTLENSYAIGDSKSDEPMLEMVENPVAFNPDNALFLSAQAKGWHIVVERKNMIYQLEYKDEQYVLAKTGQ